MLDVITELAALELNLLREFEGPEGSLFLLNFAGKDSEGNASYEEVKVYNATERVNGWGIAKVKGPDGAYYTGPQIADVDGDLTRLMNGEAIDTGKETFTDYAFGGYVYRVEKDKPIEEPATQPIVWTLRGYKTQDRYDT